MKYDDFEKEKKKTHDKVTIHELINFKNNTNIKISVVVPIFNVEDYIGPCLDSILNQTFKEFEVICVNDGSTDSSLEILKEYATKDNRIKIINKDNAGYGHTMNLGMDMASGEYFVIVESDDFILPTMFETLYGAAKKNNLDFVKSDFYRFYGEDNTNIIKDYQKLDPTDEYYNKIFSTRKNHSTYKLLMNTWTGLYNIDFLRKNNIRHSETPGASYQDNGFWFKTFFYGEKVMFIPEPFYMYRRDNPNSSVRNKTKIYAMDTEYDLINDFLEGKSKRKDFLDAFIYAKYHNFHFTMDRIGLEFKKEFLLSTSEYFNHLKANDELDTSLLDEDDLNILNWIVEKPNEYYNYMYNIESKNYDFLKKYLQCRIDIKNHGSKENDVLLIDSNDSLLSFHAPDWFKNDEGIGYLLNSNTGSLDLSLKCVNDGTITLGFKGIDYNDRKGYRIPIYIDYTEIIVDGKNLVSGSRVCWHDNPFIYQKDVKDGQIIKIQVKWRPVNSNSIFTTISDHDRLLNTFTNFRVDIKNHGMYDNDIRIINCNGSYNISKPDWFSDVSGIGSILTSNSYFIDFSFECINDGNLKINFRAPDLKNKNGGRIPIFIEYKEIMVDGENLINGNKVIWHDKPLTFSMNVKNGQIVNIKIRWKPLFSENNFNLVSDLDSSLDKFSTVRLNLKNMGSSRNNLILLNSNNCLADITQLHSYKNYKGSGTIIYSKKYNMNLSFRCINDGNLKINFGPIFIKEKNSITLPIYIDLKEIVIDGINVLKEDKVLTPETPFIYEKCIFDGQIINISLNWAPLSTKSNAYEAISKEIIKIDEIEKLKNQIRILNNENQELKEFNESILNSNSWKLTGPLRKIKHTKDKVI